MGLLRDVSEAAGRIAAVMDEWHEEEPVPDPVYSVAWLTVLGPLDEDVALQLARRAAQFTDPPTKLEELVIAALREQGL